MNPSLQTLAATFHSGQKSLRAIRSFLAVLTLAASLPCAFAADRKPSPPELTFTFASLNVPNLAMNFIGAGASMMTIHFVDENHLLLSYGLRELVPRLPGDSAEDDDRLVGAQLLELPSGKVLAKARWHLHDHARYLWNLGNGRFLMREGGELYTFAPLANLATSNAFQRVSLSHRPGVLDAVLVSPDGKLLTLETHKPEKKKLTGFNINVLTNGDLQPEHPPVAYDFYRLSGDGAANSPITPTRAGSAQAPSAMKLPIDADGYLVATGGKRGRWNVEFESFAGGKPLSVGVVDSNCRPGLELVSPTQYLAFTCRSATSDAVTVAAYDFAKNDIWEEPMGSFSVYAPVFAFAPASGRFAISRKFDMQAPGVASDPSGDITTQEVRVYGTQSGDLLLKTYCVPVFRTSENFDLSPDGMRLGVIRSGKVEIYRLPELTKADREDLAQLAKLTPASASGPMNLHRIAHETAAGVQESAAAADAADVTGQQAQEPATTAAVAPAPSSPLPPPLGDSPGPATSPSGDLEIRRKPPTLLNPGEKAEAGAKPKATADR